MAEQDEEAQEEEAAGEQEAAAAPSAATDPRIDQLVQNMQQLGQYVQQVAQAVNRPAQTAPTSFAPPPAAPAQLDQMGGAELYQYTHNQVQGLLQKQEQKMGQYMGDAFQRLGGRIMELFEIVVNTPTDFPFAKEALLMMARSPAMQFADALSAAKAKQLGQKTSQLQRQVDQDKKAQEKRKFKAGQRPRPQPMPKQRIKFNSVAAAVDQAFSMTGQHKK